MPYSYLKWTGDEPGVARIAAASRRRADEQSRLWLQADLKNATDEAQCSKEALQAVQEEVKKRDDVIAHQKALIDALHRLLEQ